MKCNGVIEVECNKCGMNQQIPCSDFTYWDEVSVDEGAAGKEVQNESMIEHNCTICQNKIDIRATVWTYHDAPSQIPDCFEIESVDGAELKSHNCKCL